MADLTILAGLPGCGKSTWAREHGERWNEHISDGTAVVVSSDELRLDLADLHAGEWSLRAFWRLAGQEPTLNDVVFELYHARISCAIDSGDHVIADATNLRAADRGKAIAAARAAVVDVPVHLVVFANIAEAFARNEARKDTDTYVPGTVMGRHYRRLSELLKQIAVGPTEPAVRSVSVLSTYWVADGRGSSCSSESSEGSSSPTRSS